MIRFFDILISLLALILLSPFFLVIGLSVLFSSKGGVFYFQDRVGKDGHDFRLIKFRSMYTGSEKKGGLTIGDADPRITAVGRFLRRYKADELPQLINVLKGEMSMVGPRPELRKYVGLYTPEQRKVLGVRPGITDYASVEYFNENELLAASSDPEKTYIEQIMPAKLALNLQYISSPDLHNYFRVIGKTLGRIFR